MKNGLSSFLIPSVTAVLGVSAACVYYNRKVEELTIKGEHIIAQKNDKICSLQDMKTDLESTQISITSALEQSQRRYGVLRRNYEIAVEERDVVISEREQAATERDTAVALLEKSDLERREALKRLEDAKEEVNELQKTVGEAEQNEQRNGEQLSNLRTENGSLVEEIDALEVENQNLKILAARKSDEIDTHIGTIAHLNKYVALTNEKQEREVQYLKEENAALHMKVLQQQSELDAFNEYAHEKEKEHQAQLFHCFEKIRVAQQELDAVYKELNSFLARHPQLDIDIALIMKAERSQGSASSSSSSPSSSESSL